MQEWTPPSIVGHTTLAADDARGGLDSIFKRLQLPVATCLPEHDWVLLETPRTTPESSLASLHDDARTAPPTLELRRPDGVMLSVDFTSGKAAHRINEAGRGIQPLARALGVPAYRKRHGVMPDIIDATGGLGQDAWALASLGCTVTIIERHPIIHALLDNALTRAFHHPAGAGIASRIRLFHGQAEVLLPELTAQAIYLDPMYPERSRGKAESRKGMQFLHELLGPPSEQADATLLAAALACAVARVAVKRPRGADTLHGTEQWAGQRTCMSTPNTRYDIYHLHADR